MPDLLYHPTTRRCGTPGCRELAGYGRSFKRGGEFVAWGAFCKDHAEYLAELAQEMILDKGLFQQRTDQRKTGYMRPRCGIVGCDEPRARGEGMCALHRMEFEDSLGDAA